MPLPLIPIVGGVIAAATAAHGVKKGLEAKHDLDESKHVYESSKDIAKEAQDFIEMAKEKTNTAIQEFGKEKIRILTTSIQDFVLNFEKIKDVDLRNSEGINELKNFNSNSDGFMQLKKASFEASQIAVNGLASIGAGALLAYGTYSVIMSGLGGLLVTATTGTAISSLSGVALTNATLAWLGGGALSATGLGMAGGIAVLGGLVVGPALAIGGSIFASQAHTALNESYNNYAKAKAFKAQARNIGIALKGICTRADQLKALLENLNIYFAQYVSSLNNIINRKGTNWSGYSAIEQEEIYKCVQLAQTIKVILDTSLIKQDGMLDDKTEQVLLNGENYLHALVKL